MKSFVILFLIVLIPYELLAKASCRDRFFGNKAKGIAWRTLESHELFLKCLEKETELESEKKDPFLFPSWCEDMATKQVAPYLKSAAEFTKLEGGALLLAIGMMGEGFRIKDEEIKHVKYFTESIKNGKSKKEEIKNKVDKSFIEETINDPNKTIIIEETLEDFTEKNTYVNTYRMDDSGRWRASGLDWSFQTGEAQTKRALKLISSGDSWPDDGADTFGLEYNCLYKLGYLPTEFTRVDFKHYNTTREGKAADFITMPLDGSGDVNEETYRFVIRGYNSLTGIKTDCQQDQPGTSNFKEKLQSARGKMPGDPGRTFFKTPEVQAYANAALWRLSQDRMNAVRREFGVTRRFTDEEIIFWSKAFYNGGQGSQAGATRLFKEYATRLNKKGQIVLSNANYLQEYPGFGSAEIYVNAKVTSATVQAMIKEEKARTPNRKCTDQFPKNPIERPYTSATE